MNGDKPFAFQWSKEDALALAVNLDFNNEDRKYTDKFCYESLQRHTVLTNRYSTL